MHLYPTQQMEVNENTAALSPGGHQSVHSAHVYPMHFLCPA